MAIGSRGLRGGEGGFMEEAWRRVVGGDREGLKRHCEEEGIRGVKRRRRRLGFGRSAMIGLVVVWLWFW